MKLKPLGHPTSDEGEDLRTVKLTGRDLHDAERLLRTLTKSDEERTPSSPRNHTHQDRERFVESARQEIKHRRARADYFPSGMFGEPAWDILLILYTDEGMDRSPVSRLITASGSAATTGLRWLEYLESQELVCRREHPTDRRVDLVELTPEGRSALDSYFFETLEVG